MGSAGDISAELFLQSFLSCPDVPGKGRKAQSTKYRSILIHLRRSRYLYMTFSLRWNWCHLIMNIP